MKRNVVNEVYLYARNRHFWVNENPRLIVAVENQIKFFVKLFCSLIYNWVHYDENLSMTNYLEISNDVTEFFVDDLPL